MSINSLKRHSCSSREFPLLIQRDGPIYSSCSFNYQAIEEDSDKINPEIVLLGIQGLGKVSLTIGRLFISRINSSKFQ